MDLGYLPQDYGVYKPLCVHDARIKIWGPNQVCTDVSRLDGSNGAYHWPLAVNPYMCVWSSRFLPLPHPHMLC